MTGSEALRTSIFPAAIARRVLRFTPLALLQPVLDLAVTGITRRHDEMMERFDDVDFPTYLIDPVDLPVVFFLRPHPETPDLTILRSGDEVEVDARIAGPILVLLDLMEGRLDGDALFFSRQLRVTGDTEAVVALRNAIDSADIDLISDALSPLGPIGEPLSTLANGIVALLSRAVQTVEGFQEQVLANMGPHEPTDGASGPAPRSQGISDP
ncbi:MAG: SCP2 domain-containing protein [Sphingomonadales bacterium]